MDRHWLLTTTFYGNWLPGDPRGCVTRVRDKREDDPETDSRFEHDIPGTPYDQDLPGMRRSAEVLMTGEVVRVNLEQAEILLKQFKETATHRKWRLLAVAIMANHLHIVVGVLGDPDPEKILGDFKAYGSRALNKGFPKPPGESWWTSRGSKRKLPNERAIRAAIEYVRNQPNPLVLWIDEEYR